MDDIEALQERIEELEDIISRLERENEDLRQILTGGEE